MKTTEPDNQPSVPAEQASDEDSIFESYTPEKMEAFEKEEEELDRLYGKDGYRPQPEGYTVDDLMEEVNKMRETGSPIVD